ncbi:MAG: lipoate--protein ligase family protein [Brevinematia bacterium]|nr:MAG: hypothetical protein C0196_03975 [Dictyoglomus turgidum]
MEGLLIDLEKVSPFFLFSLEEYLLKNLENIYLIFYSFPPSVILGRSSRVKEEVFLENIIKDNILLARRESGGGVVYIKPDQLCVSILLPKEVTLPQDLIGKYKFLTSLIVKGLKNFSCNLTFDERGNIFLKDGKISGCGGYLGKNGYLHHFTIIRKPLLNMEKYLKRIKFKTSCLNAPKEELKKVILEELEKEFNISFKEFFIDSLELEEIIKKYKDKDFIYKL